jgi:hypothetical protein
MRRFMLAAGALCLALVATSAFVAVALAARGVDGAPASCASYSPWKQN